MNEKSHIPPSKNPISINMPIEEFLSKDDYDFYINLKNTLSSKICRNCRNRRKESFSEILLAIR